MNRNYLKYFLLFSLVAFGAAVLVYLQTDETSLSTQNSELRQKRIEANFYKAYDQFQKDFLKLKVVNEKHNLTNPFAITNNSDFVIYEGDKIVYWTSNQIPLTVFQKKRSFNKTYLYTKSGSFFCFKEKLNKYDVVGFVRLSYEYPVENRFLHSSLNHEIFGNKDGNISISSQRGGMFITFKGDNLFNVKIGKIGYKTHFFTASLFLVSLITFLIFFYHQLKILYNEDKRILAFLSFTGVIIVLRTLVFVTDFFRTVVYWDIFDVAYYASSVFAPSIADFLLNLITVLLIIGYAFKVFFSKGNNSFLSSLEGEWAYLLTIVLLLTSFFSIEVIHYFLTDLFTNSSLNFDITQNLEFSLVEYVYLVAFIGLSTIYLVVNRVVFKVLNVLWGVDFKVILPLFIASLVLYSFGVSFFYELNIILIIIHSLYFFLNFLTSIYKEARNFNFKSYSYLILTSVIVSLIASYTIYQNTDKKEAFLRTKFAEKLITHDDFEAEFLLQKVTEKVKEEVSVFDSSSRSYKALQLDVKHTLGHYFDRYEVRVLFFDGQGNQLTQEENNHDYQYFKDRYQRQRFKTEYNNVYFVNFYDLGEFSKYLTFISLVNHPSIKNVVIELLSRRLSPNSVYPKVLSSNKNASDYENHEDYNYVVYENDKMLFCSGEIKYDLQAFTKELNDEDYFKSFSKDGYTHVVYRGIENKVVIVSSKDDTFFIIWTNFSFLLLTILIVTLVGLIVYILFTDVKHILPNFSTRIHLYLNFVYLLAIISISTIIISWVNKEYERDLKKSFKQEAENLRYYLVDNLDAYLNNKISESEFNEYINRLTELSRSDLNVYGVDGKLITSTQPLIYSNELVYDYINPEVYNSFVKEHHNVCLSHESIGGFAYYNVYVSLNSLEDDEFLGILSIPFFNSKEDLVRRKTKLFNTILNVFTIVFIIVLLVSYFAFLSITRPLKMISNVINNTSLSDTNQRVNWDVDDEIGMIANGYNNMISKLEHSKREMAQRQKEDAWKEMARQVAHEIKNPLTPMRLRVQQLMRRKDDLTQEDWNRTMEALLLQIDTLSDIATSFSDFAKMPTPEYTPFNIMHVLNEVAEVFGSEAAIIRNFANDEVTVMGDNKLIGRVFNNIILNSIQSVSTEVTPQVIIGTDVSENHVVISFSDNGEGIPEELRDKVFQPNFSTKYSGSGIGLAIAKRGIQHGNGEIWFESQVGRGTTFFIKLPKANK